MGTYRLILAILVVTSHGGLRVFGYNQGAAAVVSFFIISGYVTSILVEKYYNNPQKILLFYSDRCLRLFPQFIFYLLITFTVMFLTGNQLILTNPLLVVSNFLMLPLNFFAHYHNEWIAIPQSWSLGLEFQFYLLAPLIIIFRKKVITHILSLLVFTIAFSLIIQNDYNGYRMIWGTLLFFMSGVFIRSGLGRKIILLTYTYFTFLLILSYVYDSGPMLGNRNLIFGYMIGLPIVCLLTKFNYHKYDAILGDISYGVYLNHFLIFFAISELALDYKRPQVLALCVIASIVCGYASSVIIEKKMVRVRHMLRKKLKLIN